MDAGGTPGGPARREPPPDVVEELQPGDRTAAAAVLAAALADDPGYTHLFPVASRRERELREVYRMTLADGMRYGRVIVTKLGDEVTGVLALYPPATYPMSLRRWVRQAGRLARIALVTREHSGGIIRFGELTSQGVPGDAWYVEAFGVRPDLQRAGRGSLLLRRFLEDVDRAAVPSYLETTNPDNVDYYHHRGYTEAHEPVALAPEGPFIYPMTRPAARTADARA